MKKQKVKINSELLRHESLILCANYIVDNDREYIDYIEQCEEHGINPYTNIYSDHIYGVARTALGLGPLEEVDSIVF